MLAPSAAKSQSRSPWFWVPTLYFAEGLPNAIVAGVSIVLYKSLGVSNARIGLFTSLLYLPWVVKPLWSPIVELLQTRRAWIWKTQFTMAVSLALLALVVPTAHFLPLSILLFWLLAFSSATHDIAADGFYMLALNEGQQSFFIGVRNTLYRAANLFAQGPFIIFVALLQKHVGAWDKAWSISFACLAVAYAAFAAYHWFIAPHPADDRRAELPDARRFFRDFAETFRAFFRKPRIALSLAFLLFYRFGEAQLLPMVKPFLLDPRERGGLALSAEDFGIVYGTTGVIALMVGGILGGVLVSRDGLRRWIWPMLFIMHLPIGAFIFLAYALPQNLAATGVCVAIEQFGYGFGFTAYMLYMIHIARGEHQTAHYAICTGFMALGLMLPGLWSGWLQEHLGYQHFFTWALLATIPGFAVTALVPLEPEFGKRRASTANAP